MCMERKESHSSISTYLECQRKYELVYKKGLKISNHHFVFGSMAHKVLETGEVPDELLYPELKEIFKIKSWKLYFEPIFKELNNFLKDYTIIAKELPVEDDNLQGIIDLVLKHNDTGRIVLCDYKFSTSVKTYEDLFLDEQLQIYAVLYSEKYDISIQDIDICYINIPKIQLDYPRILCKGGLSKDKNQNTTYEMYIEKINELGLDIKDYEDILSNLKNKHFIQIYKNSINIDMLKRIIENIENTLKDMKKGYFLEKCTHMCKKCPFVEYCKHDKEIIQNDNSVSRNEQREIDEILE